ncbi:hypothetical protein AB0I34_43805 [Kribbella sp. NPDC050281]|uniref:hypothetical protein n=1 Tax=Kribbella sp. NPDC050281 TaxID=3155515 RepID=UPI003402FCE3
MSEETIERAVQQALTRDGIADEVIAAGQFNPRGQTGSLFAGGLAGGTLGGVGGSVGEAVGDFAGVIGGMRANAAAHGMPEYMLVGVTADGVYGFEGRSRSKEPGAMVFNVARAGLEVKVHQRVNVRVLELIHPESSSRIELEGSRVPLTHSKDVIEALSEG